MGQEGLIVLALTPVPASTGLALSQCLTPAERFAWAFGPFKPYGFVNVGVQKKLKNDKGTLRLSVTDLFWNMRVEVVNDLPALGMYQNLGFLFEPRVVRLTYSRNFGNQNVKAAKQRATGSEEERRRVQ